MQGETLQVCFSVQFRKVVCSSCRCVCRDVFVRSLQAQCRIAALAAAVGEVQRPLVCETVQVGSSAVSHVCLQSCRPAVCR